MVINTADSLIFYGALERTRSFFHVHGVDTRRVNLDQYIRLGGDGGARNPGKFISRRVRVRGSGDGEHFRGHLYG